MGRGALGVGKYWAENARVTRSIFSDPERDRCEQQAVTAGTRRYGAYSCSAPLEVLAAQLPVAPLATAPR
jgi:hypothetical protein